MKIAVIFSLMFAFSGIFVASAQSSDDGVLTYLLTVVINLSSDMRVLQNANAALQTSLDEMQTSLGGMQTSVDALGGRVSHAEENIAQTQGDLEAVAELSTELNGLSTELDELKSTFGVYGSQIKEIEGRVGVVESDTANLQTDVTSNSHDITNLQSKDEEIHTEINTLQALEGTLQQYGSQLTQLNNTVHSADDDFTCIKNNYLADRFPYDGAEYHVSRYGMNWGDARKYCQSLGGDLIVNGLQDWNQRLKIVNYLRLYHGETRYWIGLTDQAREGTWQWIKTPNSGSDIYWATGEPNSKGNEDCADMRADDGWKTNDNNCNVNQYAICEHTVVKC